MKKTLVLLSSMAVLSLAHAGSMGDVSTQKTGAGISPFVSLEASYNWNTLDGGSISNLVSTRTENQGWGGRVGAGFTVPHSEKLGFSSEIGFGYFGSTNYSNPNGNFSSKSSLDGLDLLVGAFYKWNQFDLFFKAGGLVENKLTTKSASGGTFLMHSTGLSFSHTEVLPEIKVGGIYNLTDHVGLSVAYMNAFGSNSSLSSARTIYSVEPPSAAIEMNGNVRNPSIQAVMFGLTYNI